MPGSTITKLQAEKEGLDKIFKIQVLNGENVVVLCA